MFDFMAWLFWERTPVAVEQKAGWVQRRSDCCVEEINLLPLRALNPGPCQPVI